MRSISSTTVCIISTWIACALILGTPRNTQAAVAKKATKTPAAAPTSSQGAPRKEQAPAEPSPGEIFDRGRVAFDRGEYALAIELLRPMLYPNIRMDEESQVVRSHRMLGVAHLFENQQAQARQEFLRLLELRPDYRFDPLLDPPRVVDFFNEILREQEAQIASLDRRRKEAEAAEANRIRPRPAQVLERNFERHSLAVALIPFGAGQFQNGHARKGWIFLGAESSLAVVSLAAFTTNFLLYGTSYTLGCKSEPPVVGGASGQCAGDDVDRTPVDRSTLLLNVQLVTGGLFFAAAAWGVVDALIHFEASPQIGPPRLTPVTAAPKPPSSAWQVSIVPARVAGAWGPGLSLRF